jgi:hypothetical protein
MFLARNLSACSALTSSPIARISLGIFLFISVVLLFFSPENIPNARHMFKPPPSAPPGRSPGHNFGQGALSGMKGSHIGDPSSQTLREWRKPAGMKVIGLVFYGRKDFVEVLDCYLQVRC